MNVRSRSLPPGWYPAGRTQTIREIEGFLKEIGDRAALARAGVAPHAGWSFSGRTACRVMASIPEEIETVVVVGGHLGPRDGLLAAREAGYETPLGVMESDRELLQAVESALQLREDRYADNTVEVQLPFLHYFLPGAKVLGMRAAPSQAAVSLGEALFQAAERLGRKVAVIGSTDLTHYGASYGFSPKGSGAQALKWVKKVNDRRVIDALLALELDKALDLAVSEHSACSIGGAVTAARFAQLQGAEAGTLLEYRTSYDVYPGESFVGYAGIIYPESGQPRKSTNP